MTWSAPAMAFDYIEHLWFTDDACRRVQEVLAGELASNERLGPPFLALALACPVDWEQPYCSKGDKVARGHLNLVPDGSRAYSATLGDFSALADHVSRQGPIRNLPRARSRGLTRDLLRWLAGPLGGVDGPIGDVAEDACELKGQGDLAGAQRDIDERLTTWWTAGKANSVPSEQLRAIAREPLRRGPHDPPMTYSFDNPHYLDLVLRNHHHFGDGAHDAWNGFHGAATQMTGRSCADLIVVDDDEAEDLADHVPGYEDVKWHKIPEAELPVRVCGMLAEVVRERVKSWAKASPSQLSKPAADLVARIQTDPTLADQVVASLLSLVFEGTGLHYLQDGLAGGHMRTIRSREALVEVRHDHDEDNRDGVSAVMTTPNGSVAFVGWGDGYLLGRAPADRCDWKSTAPAVTSTCLLAQQRGLIALATMASLLDWAHGGPAYRGLQCDAPERAICMGLPLHAPRIASTATETETSRQLLPGTLPVPPPDFSYEALSLGFSYAPWTATPSFSTRFSAYQEMDIPAHWLRSWQIRLEAGLGDGPNQSLVTDLGFGFHYRFYARVMLDLIPVAFIGLRDFSDGAVLHAGLAPRIGLSFLPEGWVKIPIEFGLHAEAPITFFATDSAAFSEVGGTRPRFTIGFGLAFMH